MVAESFLIPDLTAQERERQPDARPSKPTETNPSREEQMDVLAFRPGIEKILVYSDRALVTRTGNISLQKGKNILQVRNLLPNLARESIRAFSSDPLAIVQGSNTYLDWKQVPSEDKEKNLKSEIQNLEQKIESENKNIFRVKKDLRGIEDYSGFLAKKISEESSGTKNSESKWKSALRLLTERRGVQKTKLQELEESVKGLREELNILQKNYAQVRSKTQKSERIVEIVVQVPETKAYPISFSYIVPNVSWKVGYNIYWTDPKKLEIEVSGSIFQNTGEDWIGVPLSLSTSRPAKSSDRPVLSPLLAGFKRKRVTEQYIQVEKDIGPDLEDGALGAEPIAESENEYSDLESSQESVLFHLRESSTVYSGSRPQIVSIARYSERIENTKFLFYGSDSPLTYQILEFKNKRDFPLLSGDVQCFKEVGFVGKTRLKYASPNQPVKISFGPDRQIRAIRNIRNYTDSAGALSREKRFRTSISIEVQNLSGTRAMVQVVERIPISELEEIKVKLEKTNLEPSDTNGKGFLTWNLDLGPGEKKEILFEYSIRAPGDSGFSP
jgi:uncharacterized protein (TIGR02231 family)